MDGNGMLSASDVAMLTGNNNGWGDGGAFMWIFALLILANGGFGNWGGAGNGNAIQADVNRGFDNQNLHAQTRDILTAVNNGTAQNVAATNQTFHDSLAAMQNLYNETARDIAALGVGQANLLANQNNCCCTTKQLISESKYDTAMQLAGVEQRIMAKMDANKIEELQNQVNQLQLAQATAGMLRFPNSWTYGAGQFPPIFGGCCGNNI